MNSKHVEVLHRMANGQVANPAVLTAPLSSPASVDAARQAGASSPTQQPSTNSPEIGSKLVDGQPPAEAQPVAKGNWVRGLKPDGTPLPPPSAPVGVGVVDELLTNIQRACKRGRNSADLTPENSRLLDSFDHIEDLAQQAIRTLAQQPAPVATVGVEGPPKSWNPCSRCRTKGKSDDCERCGGSGWRKKCNALDCLEYGCNGYGFCLVTKDELAAALAQQPTAVDEAMVELARKARRLQHDHFGDGMSLHLSMMDWAREYDALAAQQGGVK